MAEIGWSIISVAYLLATVEMQASQQEAVRQREALTNEANCLRGELQQLREDRDSLVARYKALVAQFENEKELTAKTTSKLAGLTTKVDLLEVSCLLNFIFFHCFQS